MRFSVLGPLEVSRDEQPVPLGGPKPRALLGVLLLHPNEVVARERLIDALWGWQPPPRAAESLDTYVYRLRKLLGHDRIERRGGGYRLRVEPGERDVDEFERLVGRARSAQAAWGPGGRGQCARRRARPLAGSGVGGTARRSSDRRRGASARGGATLRARVSDRGAARGRWRGRAGRRARAAGRGASAA